MKLEQTSVRLFRNVVDSNNVEIDSSVTSLVGKNESGKTALLWALRNLNPADGFKIDLTLDYPRWRKVKDERDQDISKIDFVEADFSLTEKERETVSSIVNMPLLPSSTTVTARRNYEGKLAVRLNIQEKDFVKVLIEGVQSDQIKDMLNDMTNFDELQKKLEEVQVSANKTTKLYKEAHECATQFASAKSLMEYYFTQEQMPQVEKLIPKFFYFGEYNLLPGRIDLQKLLNRPTESLDPSERTAKSLLNLVGVEGKEFTINNFEERKAELEAAANEVSRQVFEYWTQNKELSVSLEVDSETIPNQNGQTAVHKFLDVRLRDQRHSMTTNFRTRSSGFQWFFSFIVAFTEFERDENVIILLDEPGLGLHARAQANLLDFIENRLGKSMQVIFTTHSPFMINPKYLERARLVEDLSTQDNPGLGCKIFSDAYAVKGDTRFPLQAALGYDLAQNLFIGGFNLIVEGTSDLIYIDVLSTFLSQSGRETLNNKFTIVPVGGIDKIPTFIALLGNHLDCTVLVDGQVSANQKLQDMITKGLISTDRLVAIHSIVSKRGASVEDLFQAEEYITLYNRSFNVALDPSSFNKSESIIAQIEKSIGYKFDHKTPAYFLLRNRDFLDELSDETSQKFELLFKMLNKTLDE